MRLNFALFRKPAVASELLQQRCGALVKAELLFELVDLLGVQAVDTFEIGRLK
ncbi:MAG: hypothetical protein IPM81_12955 [Saprospirales bacterium]|nr:hypothetical protein [Saprospirales bacterium]